MSKKEAINYWLESAKRDKETALDMFRSGHYNWSLFLWHLVIERTIKALMVKNGKEILPVHDLVRLAEAAELNLSEEQKAILREMTTFNIEARYDDYKEQFYKKATRKFALEWGKKAREMQRWLGKQL